MSNGVKLDCRQFLRDSAMTIATTKFAALGSATALASTKSQQQRARAESSMNASFASLKHIDAGVLNVAYAEVGPTTQAHAVVPSARTAADLLLIMPPA